jgi:CheY-like chemotaxis protein/glycine cleavage system H lipoate-binding protein
MQNQSSRSKRILVVDDEINVCKSIKNAIQQEDYEIEIALSGEEALEKEKESPFDLIISDLMMPGISGLDLLKTLKRWRPEIMIIMVTGYPTIRTAVESIRIGAFDYISKPFTPQELRSLTARAFKQLETSGRGDYAPPLPSGLFYMIGHTWLREENEQVCTVGLVHDYLKTINDIQSLELPDINQAVSQGEICARIMDRDGDIHRIWSPASGLVLDINGRLQQSPALLLSSPYNEGWLYKITPTNLEEDLKGLIKS